MINLVLVTLITISPDLIPEKATFDWLMPGPRFESPEDVIESYWQTMNEQNLEKLALHFSYVTLFDAPEVAAAMWPCNIKNYGIEILEKTVLNDTLIHFKYYVKLKHKKFKSGDLMHYNPDFGWRILAPCSDPPQLDNLK